MKARSGSVMHFPSTPTPAGGGGISRASSMFFSNHPMGTTPANTTTPTTGGPNISAAIVAATTAAATTAHQVNNQRQSMSSKVIAPTPKSGVSARGVGFNMGGAPSSAGAGVNESTKNTHPLNPTLARQLNVRGLETVTMLLAEMGDGSSMRSAKSINNMSNRRNSVNNSSMSRPKSALTMVANGNATTNVTTGGMSSSIEKENQPQPHQSTQPTNQQQGIPTMSEPEEELDTVAIANIKQR